MHRQFYFPHGALRSMSEPGSAKPASPRPRAIAASASRSAGLGSAMRAPVVGSRHLARASTTHGIHSSRLWYMAGVWVHPERLEVRRSSVGALPVVNAVLGRLGFDELVSSFLGAPRPAMSHRAGAGDRRARAQPRAARLTGSRPGRPSASRSCSVSPTARPLVSTTTGSDGPLTSCSSRTAPACG